MNTIYLPFNDVADREIADINARGCIIAAAVAFAISQAALLPTSPVEVADSFYTTQILPQARQLLSAFNENIVFDLRAAQQDLRTFWMMRYVAAHPITYPLYTENYGFFDCMLGVNAYVSDEQHAFFNEHKKAIMMLAAEARVIVEKINEPAKVF